jgi:glycosyltransferase involved in cell wall biosynthesis
MASSSTDILIAVGNRIRADLIGSGIGTPQKLQVIYPGVFTDRDLVFRNKDQDKINLLYVGRLEPIKQPEFLLQICRELELLSCSYQLNVVGEGSMFEKVRDLAIKDKLKITFHGWQIELDEYFYEADLLLLGSISEGTPIVIVEAATFGVPTLTTNVGAIQEMITNEVSGFVESDIESFAARIRFLSRNRSTLTAVGLKAKSEMSEMFGLSQFIMSHQDVYSQAIKTRLKKEVQ